MGIGSVDPVARLLPLGEEEVGEPVVVVVAGTDAESAPELVVGQAGPACLGLLVFATSDALANNNNNKPAPSRPAAAPPRPAVQPHPGGAGFGGQPGRGAMGGNNMMGGNRPGMPGGKSRQCVSEDPHMVAAMRAITSSSFLIFYWDRAGNCSQIVVESASDAEPK